MSPTGMESVGAVVIGRNEGERLARCLESVRAVIDRVVYVDSGSTDGSIERAKAMGCDVVELDPSTPFTAARARNAGFRRLLEAQPDLEFVQFIDGDCVLDSSWTEHALAEFARRERAAVVCGRRRERRPEASIYNRLCDVEWNTPVGEAGACGGDSLMRVAALREVGGFRDDLIAGEEPELCLRLRDNDWTIHRIDREMTLHDADMTRFGQWWRRAMRCGHAFAEGYALHGGPPHRFRRREVCSAIIWGAALPLASVVLAPFTFGLSLLFFGLYALLWLRIYGRELKRCGSTSTANLYAGFCILAKVPTVIGIMSFWWCRFRGTRRQIIEYKPSGLEATTGDRPRLLYVAGTLPARSETFVYRELLGLRERGWTVDAASIHAPERGLGAPDLEALADEAIQVYGRGPLALLRAAGMEVIRHPLASIRTLGWAGWLALTADDLPHARRPKILWQALAAVSVADRARERGVRHIHAHMAHVPTTIAMFLARHLGVSFSFTGHAVDLFQERTLLETKLARAAFCACISDWHQAWYLEQHATDSDRLPVVRCGVDVDEFSPRRSIRNDGEPFRIVAVGRLVEKKGVDVLLRALCGFDTGRFECDIVGDGPEQSRLETILADHPARNSVRLHGARRNGEVRNLIRCADAFVLPCRITATGDRDGIPVVLMEAMACGVPVIAGDLPAIRELVIHERTGLLVSPGSVERTRDAIHRLMDDAGLRQRLGAEARRRVAEEFSSRVNVERLERAILATFGLTPAGLARTADQTIDHPARTAA